MAANAKLHSRHTGEAWLTKNGKTVPTHVRAFRRMAVVLAYEAHAQGGAPEVVGAPQASLSVARVLEGKLREALWRIDVVLSGRLQAVLQATVGNGLSFDPSE